MLVVSLPMVTWADLPLDRMPNLRALLDRSIVAGLSVRGVHRKPTLGDAYVTISAGTRAVVPRVQIQMRPRRRRADELVQI